MASDLVPIEEKAIDFHGDRIYAVLVERGGEQVIYVPIKPISDALGLAWHGQYQRIERDPELSEVSELIPITGINIKSGNQEYLALPLEFLAGWLFGVQTNRVKAELRPKIRQYKLECYKVLSSHFAGEMPIRKGQSSLAQIRATALAVASLAEQQMQIEGRVDHLDSRILRQGRPGDRWREPAPNLS
jgi:hypothetical protein